MQHVYEKNDAIGRKMQVTISMYQIQNLEAAKRKNGELNWDESLAPSEIMDFVNSAVDEKFRELE